jgi:hypothetical protein
MMSADLERLFSSLRTDSERATVPPPDSLRRRGNRRRTARTVAGLAAVAVLVAGTALSTHRLLAQPVTPAPAVSDTVPTPDASPSPIISVTVTPEPDPATITVRLPCGDDRVTFSNAEHRYEGQALPASVMLRARDWGPCYVVTVDHPGYVVSEPGEVGDRVLGICPDSTAYRTDADRVAGRVRHFIGGPVTAGLESTTRYRSGAAVTFLDEVRAQVARCADFTPKDTPGDWHARIVARNFIGDESLLVYVGTGTAGAGYPGWYIGVARQGDVVVVVEPTFDLGGDRGYATSMTRKATARL